MEKEIRVGSQTIELSNLEKEMYPRDHITKQDVVNYYRKISDFMLPYLKNRPISMQRFPDGIEAFSFYQKEIPDYFPEWIDRVKITLKESGEKQYQVVCNKSETLVYLANQACIVLHPWLSHTHSLNRPDKMIFDLDPPDTGFEPVRQAGFDLHDLLENLGFYSFVMTTGSRGLHVVVPLDGKSGFDEVSEFAGGIAEALAKAHPDRLTVEIRKNKRNGRLFLDTLRNAFGQTAIAPYGLRALPGAPVAAPLDWEELKDKSLGAQRYNIHNIFRRLGQKDDPWIDMFENRSSLKNRKLGEIQDLMM